MADRAQNEEVQLSAREAVGLWIQSSSLESVSIVRGTHSRDMSFVPDHTRLHFHVGRVSLERHDTQFIVQVPYSVTASSKEEQILKVEVTFELIYSSPIPLPDDHFAEFRNGYLHFVAWPYFRQYISSLTAQMGMPALTPPAVLPPISGPSSAEQKPPKKKRRKSSSTKS